MKIEITNSTKHKISKQSILNTCKKFFARKKISGFQLGIHFVGKFKIRSLNQKFRKINQVTDVLSFPQVRNVKELKTVKIPAMSLGDIFICYDQAQKQASKIKRNTKDEVFFLIQHGLKHLIGIHHR